LQVLISIIIFILNKYLRPKLLRGRSSELKTKALSKDRAFVTSLELHGQGRANAVEGVVDLLAERGHDRDHDDGDERENDRIFDETLTFFFGSE